MKRLIALLASLGLVLMVGAAAMAQHHGQHGSRRGNSGMQGPHATQDRSKLQQQQQQRSRLHDCNQACVRAQEESKQLQRYADRDRFEAETARRFGNQLGEHLEVMDREHARLRERLTREEQERNGDRLEAMDACQARWQQAFEGIERELANDRPNHERLRSRARTIEKEIKKYRTELRKLEESIPAED